MTIQDLVDNMEQNNVPSDVIATVSRAYRELCSHLNYEDCLPDKLVESVGWLVEQCESLSSATREA